MVFTILLSVLGSLLFLFILIFFAAAIGYRKIFDRRYDGSRYLKYFTEEDFPGLRAEPIAFPSDRGQILRGFLYSRVDDPCGLLIFVHGFGAGHRAYTTEIDYLAKCGFLVLAYDGTGCALSDGIFRGFDQGPVDLAAALRFAASDVRLRGFERIALVGHSWGAFSVMNALEADERVAGCVAMSGFVSSAGAMGQQGSPHFYPLALLLRLCFWILNRLRFKEQANKNSIRSLTGTKKRALLLFGKEDGVIPYRYNGARIARAVKGMDNIECVCCEGKRHNVYLSGRAEAYMNGEFASLNALAKKCEERAQEILAPVDYALLTEEDAAIMEKIKNFCASVLGDEKSV